MSADRTGPRRRELRFSAGKFERHVLSAIAAARIVLGIMALTTIAFWMVLPVDDGNWYFQFLALGAAFGLLTYCLKFLYGTAEKDDRTGIT